MISVTQRLCNLYYMVRGIFLKECFKVFIKVEESLVFKLYQNEILTILLNLQINILVHRQQGIDLVEGYLFWAVNTAGVSQRSIFGSFLFLTYTKIFFENSPRKKPSAQSSFRKLNVDNICKKARKIRYSTFEAWSNFTVFGLVPSILARIVVPEISWSLLFPII